jgi:replicative DNA helicase Mcm
MSADTEPPRDIGSEFREFFKMFAEPNGRRKYVERIAAMAQSDSASFNIDYSDLEAYSSDLAVLLVKKPKEALEGVRRAAYDVLSVEFPSYAALVNVEDIFPKIVGLTNKIDLRKIDTRHLNTMIYTSGIATSISVPGHFITEAVWECPNHDQTIEVQDDPLRVERPLSCSNPSCEETRFKLDLERSKYIDYQSMVLQELPEETPAGEVPRSFNVNLFADSINVVRPGDRVGLVGIIKAVPIEGFVKGRVFSTQINCNYIEPLNKDPLKIVITEDDEREIKAIAADPEAYRKLVQSIAPAIFGHEDEKEAILLTLSGSPATTLPDGTRLRGLVHFLMVGDPGTSKSAMLRFASEVAPRSVFVSGKGASAAGLSAAIVKNKDSTTALEAGTMVLADGGVAIVDEAEKMRPEDRVALHEAMEQGTISIAKAGFHVRLNARASLLAAANPNMGKYDPTLSLTDQVNFLPSLISRFDLIFVVLDERNKEKDRLIANHIIAVRKNRQYASEPPVRFDLLKKYIAYAKKFDPYPSDEANKKLEEFYLDMRANVPVGGIPPTPRTLESLIRLATCRARILLRNTVTVEDADAAIRLIRRFIYDVATDKSTGKLDFAQPATGISRERITKEQAFGGAVKKLKEQSPNGEIKYHELVNELIASGMYTEEEANKAIELRLRAAKMFEPRKGFLKWIDTT